MYENRVKVEWEVSESNKDCYYNVYQAGNGRFTSKVENELIFVTARNVSYFIDETKEDYEYSVSALNRYNIEGEVSKPAIINKKELTKMDNKE